MLYFDEQKKKVLASASKNGGNNTGGMMVHRQTIDMESFKSNYGNLCHFVFCAYEKEFMYHYEAWDHF